MILIFCFRIFVSETITIKLMSGLSINKRKPGSICTATSMFHYNQKHPLFFILQQKLRAFAVENCNEMREIDFASA